MSQSAFKSLWVQETVDNVFEQSIVERCVDDLPAGEVLIRVAYSSLNFKDALSAHGNRGVTRLYPHAPGIDAAGVVETDSSGQFAPGAEVIVTGYDLGMNTAGGLAGYIRVPAAWVVPLPAGLSLRESMILGTAGLTAALCVEKLLQMGATPADGGVIVTGATGGVGSIAVALLSKLGFEVSAATGKLDAGERLIALGAKNIIDRDALIENAQRPMLKPQWAHGVDCLGGEHLFGVVKSLHYGGSVAACGLAAGTTFAGNVFPFILRGVNLLGVDSVELPLSVKAAMWQRLASEFALPNLALLAEEIRLEQVPQHLVQMINGHALGRYLVNVGE